MRKCRQCRAEIPKKKDCSGDPIRAGGFCNLTCLSDYGREKVYKRLEAKKREYVRKGREKLKGKSEHAREAQAAFNAFIRERDKNKPCISCGRHHQGQYHAGHYRTVGANPELRFEELNVQKQCAPCNNHKSGNIVEYRINLVHRVGQENVDWLEGPHEPKRYTVEDLKEIKALYRKKLRELKRL